MVQRAPAVFDKAAELKRFLKSGTQHLARADSVPEGAREIAQAAYAAALDEDADSDEAAKVIDKGVRFFKNFVPYGAQIHKTVSGHRALKDGYIDFRGESIDLEKKDRASALIFGPTQTPSVRKHKHERER